MNPCFKAARVRQEVALVLGKFGHESGEAAESTRSHWQTRAQKPGKTKQVHKVS